MTNKEWANKQRHLARINKKLKWISQFVYDNAPPKDKEKYFPEYQELLEQWGKLHFELKTKKRFKIGR